MVERITWGFGMSPVRPAMQRERLKSSAIVMDIIDGPPPDKLLPDYSTALDDLSTVKGLFNRTWREDQWDWFTVRAQLGHPSPGVARLIGKHLADLRTAIRDSKPALFGTTRERLRQLPTERCLRTFLGEATPARAQVLGWLYVLSTRDLPDVLKIGMTARTVEERVREINCATGLLTPFGVRRCWQVADPVGAERRVHAALSWCRIRADREFFRLTIGRAESEIRRVLASEHSPAPSLKPAA